MTTNQRFAQRLDSARVVVEEKRFLLCRLRHLQCAILLRIELSSVIHNQRYAKSRVRSGPWFSRRAWHCPVNIQVLKMYRPDHTWRLQNWRFDGSALLCSGSEISFVNLAKETA